jgi:hypothetical protein
MEETTRNKAEGQELLEEENSNIYIYVDYYLVNNLMAYNHTKYHVSVSSTTRFLEIAREGTPWEGLPLPPRGRDPPPPEVNM